MHSYEETEIFVSPSDCSLRRTNQNWERVCALFHPLFLICALLLLLFSWCVYDVHLYDSMYILITGTLMWNDFQLLFNYKRDRSCCNVFSCVCIWHKDFLFERKNLKEKYIQKKIIKQVRVTIVILSSWSNYKRISTKNNFQFLNWSNKKLKSISVTYYLSKEKKRNSSDSLLKVYPFVRIFGKVGMPNEVNN